MASLTRISTFLLRFLPEWALMILRRVERWYGFCAGAMAIDVLGVGCRELGCGLTSLAAGSTVRAYDVYRQLRVLVQTMTGFTCFYWFFVVRPCLSNRLLW